LNATTRAANQLDIARQNGGALPCRGYHLLPGSSKNIVKMRPWYFTPAGARLVAEKIKKGNPPRLWIDCLVKTAARKRRGISRITDTIGTDLAGVELRPGP
jgi:hypothetical protein